MFLGSKKMVAFKKIGFIVLFFLKEFYDLNLTIPHTHFTETNDFSRVGLFVGHELFINKFSIETQIGYYVKYPFKHRSLLYETLGLKRYINVL